MDIGKLCLSMRLLFGIPPVIFASLVIGNLFGSLGCMELMPYARDFFVLRKLLHENPADFMTSSRSLESDMKYRMPRNRIIIPKIRPGIVDVITCICTLLIAL